MLRSNAWTLVLLWGLGCQSAPSSWLDTREMTPIPDSPLARLTGVEAVGEPSSEPVRSHSLKQTATTMQTPAEDTDKDLLTQAIVCLQQGEEEKACSHLRRYVHGHPNVATARTFLIEVLVKLDRLGEAKELLETTIAKSALAERPDISSLVESHGRMLALAEKEDDEYQVHLQRGMGLFWLAKERAGVSELGDDLPIETILVKSAGELQAAHSLQPKQARPCVYLHAVWKQLGQREQSNRWLARARETAIFGGLPAPEQRLLEMAYRTQSPEPRR